MLPNMMYRAHPAVLTGTEMEKVWETVGLPGSVTVFRHFPAENSFYE